MSQFLLNIWWRLFPSCNIRVYHRMIQFVTQNSKEWPREAARTSLKTAWNQCSKREQVYLYLRSYHVVELHDAIIQI